MGCGGGGRGGSDLFHFLCSVGLRVLENFGAAADFDEALVRAREHARLHETQVGSSPKGGRGGGEGVRLGHLRVFVSALQQLANDLNFFGDLGESVDVFEEEGGVAAYGEHGAHLREHLRLQQR